MEEPTPIALRDRKAIWHPFTNHQTHPLARGIIRGNGSLLETEDGHLVIDAISSWWVNLHGHSHPYIIQKIIKQLEKLEHVIFAGFTHEAGVLLAERLLSLAPGEMGKVFYSDNGSTAVETALKMAIQYWHNQGLPRKTVICFRGGYHGDTFGAMAAAGKNRYNKPFWSFLFDVKMIDLPTTHSLKQLQAILEEEEPACFIYEPLVLASGGMISFSPDSLEPLLKLCRDEGVLLIADEVMTGFGRLGPLFASTLMQTKPDFLCLSKGITGGFLPLGATLCRQAIFDAFNDQAFLHGHSYTGNPLACASALASLDLLELPSCSLARKQIQLSHEAFCKKWKNHPKLLRCETVGTLLILEYRDLISFAHPNILLRPILNVLYVLPPYCTTLQQLDQIYAAIEDTL